VKSVDPNNFTSKSNDLQVQRWAMLDVLWDDLLDVLRRRGTASGSIRSVTAKAPDGADDGGYGAGHGFGTPYFTNSSAIFGTISFAAERSAPARKGSTYRIANPLP
jgi:hypothetical protein